MGNKPYKGFDTTLGSYLVSSHPPGIPLSRLWRGAPLRAQAHFELCNLNFKKPHEAHSDARVRAVLQFRERVSSSQTRESNRRVGWSYFRVPDSNLGQTAKRVDKRCECAKNIVCK